MSAMLTHRARLLIVAVAGILLGPTARASDLLQLEAKIPLGEVSGRIDHMAIDLARGRLFVAELGNDSVGIVDLSARKMLRRLTGLKEPQGVGYIADADMLYVANAGDGSVRAYRGADYATAGRIDLGGDADNIRVDPRTNRLLVGYGSGGVAVLDPAMQRKLADIALPAHPEAFQIDAGANRVFINLPDARAIAVADLDSATPIAIWHNRGADGNFPMALDLVAGRVLTVFRRPARLGVFAMRDGAPVASVESCGDADDVFVDAKRKRIYVSCGDGHIDVFDAERNEYSRIAHIATVSGARTSLFIPEMDRLLLAVRARGSEPAAIWIYRPAP